MKGRDFEGKSSRPAAPLDDTSVNRISRGRFLKQAGLAAAGGFALASCGGGGTSGDVEMRFMTWGRPDTVTWTSQTFERVAPKKAKRFNVKPVVGGEGDAEVAEKFRLALSAGGRDVPDIIMLNYTQIPEFAQAGVLTDMTEMMESYSSDLLDPVKELITYEDKIVAIPYEMKTKIWFYRQDLFEKAGIDPDGIADMDDFISAGLLYHEALPDSYIWNTGTDFGGYKLENQLSSFAPISFFDRSSGEYQVTSEEGFRVAFEVLKKAYDSGAVSKVDDFAPDWGQAFASGAIGSSLINSWMSSFLPEYAGKEQKGLWRVHAWPATGPSNQGSDAGGSVFVIPNTGQNTEAAFEYLSTVYLNRDGVLRNLQTRGIVPPFNNVREEVANVTRPESNPTGLPWLPEYFGEDYFEVGLDALTRLAWVEKDPRAQKEKDILDEWYIKCLGGDVDVEEALERAQSDLQSQIGNPWEE